MQRAPLQIKKPGSLGLFLPSYAAASQYPALKGLLIRNASGETSTSLSVGIFSPLSVTGAAGAAASVP